MLPRARSVGGGSVNRFIAAGWIAVVYDNGFYRQLCLTDKGRFAHAALAAQPDVKKGKRPPE